MSRHRLRAGGRYDGARLLAFLGAHAVAGVESFDGTTYARSVRTPSGAVVAAMSSADGGIDVRLTGPSDATPVVLQRLGHLLSLAGDTADAERHLAGDAVVGRSVLARSGLRSPGSLDDGETLVRTVVGQQVSLAGARTVLGRMAADFGEALPEKVDGVGLLFPTMAALAAADPLRLPMPRSRARAVVACAGAAEGGLPARSALLALSGVGPWTADYVDLRCRRDPDVFLASDLAVRRMFERVGLDGAPKAAAARAAGWSPYRSTALIHLWTDYLEPPPTPATPHLPH